MLFWRLSIIYISLNNNLESSLTLFAVFASLSFFITKTIYTLTYFLYDSKSFLKPLSHYEEATRMITKFSEKIIKNINVKLHSRVSLGGETFAFVHCFLYSAANLICFHWNDFRFSLLVYNTMVLLYKMWFGDLSIQIPDIWKILEFLLCCLQVHRYLLAMWKWGIAVFLLTLHVVMYMLILCAFHKWWVSSGHKADFHFFNF